MQVCRYAGMQVESADISVTLSPCHPSSGLSSMTLVFPWEFNVTIRIPLTGLLFLLMAFLVLAFPGAAWAQGLPRSIHYISIDEVADLVQEGQVREIFVNGDELQIVLVNNLQNFSQKESGIGIVDTLRMLGVSSEQLSLVRITVVPPSMWANLGPLMIRMLPILIIVAFLLYTFSRARAPDDQSLAFAKSKARRFTGDLVNVRFNQVAGNDESKQALQEVVEFLREPLKFAVLGARMPKGVLLAGPPGTGKTLMAKAVAGEAGVPFFSVSGSEFVEMYVGVGASRVRDLFTQAKRCSPSIIFIDELDAIGRRRGEGDNGGVEEREQTLNQILVEMDGFDTDTHVIILAATNRADVLDQALLRPGRFDRSVTMDAPDVKGRREILNVHRRGKVLAPDVDLDLVAKQTPGFVGADLENLMNEAAILAARRNIDAVGMPELQEAIERVMAGPELRSRRLSDREREIIAYHEAGHAIVMHFLPNHDPVHKVTIVRRGSAGGYTLSLPKEESRLIVRSQLLDQLAALLGGRIAEDLCFGDITTSATNDLERASNLARTMVTQWGMSDSLGPIQYGVRQELNHLAGAGSEICNYSDRVAEKIDEEVRGIVDQANEQARWLLITHRDALDRIAQHLLEVETINAEEFRALMRGESLSTRVTSTQPAPVEEETENAKARYPGDTRGAEGGRPLIIPG
jgi:cell division protease FtsH